MRCTTLSAFALAAFGTTAQAAMVSFYLDQTNAEPFLADGTNYLRVDVEDFGQSDIRFTVSMLSPLTSIAETQFGIQSFGFNIVPDINNALTITASNVIGLPGGWSFSTDAYQDGFGEFEINLYGSDFNEQSPTLMFYITGVAGDKPTDYVALSQGVAPRGNQYFAAQVAGFLDQDPGAQTLTSAAFAGSTVVPLPAPLLLLGSGLLGFLGLMRNPVNRTLATTLRAPH